MQNLGQFWVQFNNLGTPRVVTDDAQTVVWKWDSTPFGEAAPNEDPNGDGNDFTLNLRFPGQYYDAESGLHYNYYRDYDPTTGRYVESDPIGLDGGTNIFAAVQASPLTNFDRFGLNPVVKAWFDYLIRNVGCEAAKLIVGYHANKFDQGVIQEYEKLKKLHNETLKYELDECTLEDCPALFKECVRLASEKHMKNNMHIFDDKERRIAGNPWREAANYICPIAP